VAKVKGKQLNDWDVSGELMLGILEAASRDA
jgi:hypothetical protein